jgi:NADH-quinone oxidoreductase subunit L
VSQLGYMFMACGVGAYEAGIFHLMTHAFFKALLFLGAGSVIHALSDEQDLRRMGGLARPLPWTHATMLVATIAIAGLPPFAGFFSKDEILSLDFSSHHTGVWLAGVLGAVLTAFYMFRLYILCFRGRPRMSHEVAHHVHESPRSMIIPLVVLAVLATVGGWIGLPMIEGGHPFERWLAPVFESGGGVVPPHPRPRTELELIAVSVAAALLGIGLAFRVYLRRPEVATALAGRFAGLQRLLVHKYWIDELYGVVLVRPFYAIAGWFWRFWDEVIVDGSVNGLASVVEGASAVLRLFQTGFVGTYALFFALGVAALLLHFLGHR